MPFRLTIGSIVGTVTLDALVDGFCLEGSDLTGVVFTPQPNPTEEERFFYDEFKRRWDDPSRGVLAAIGEAIEEVRKRRGLKEGLVTFREVLRRATLRYLEGTYRKNAWGLHDPDFAGTARSTGIGTAKALKRLLDSYGPAPTCGEMLEGAYSVVPLKGVANGRTAPKQFDRVHKYESRWWFWEETNADRMGPYNTENAARKGFEDYIDSELGRCVQAGTTRTVASVEVTNHGKGAVTVYIGHGRIAMSGDDSEPMEVTFRTV